LADQLAPGTWWLHETRGCNVYAIEARDGQVALVDTGFASSAAGILRELDDLRLRDRLTTILLTHMHADHAGAAQLLQLATGARVVAGLGDCVERDGAYVLKWRVGRTHVGRFVISRVLRRQAPSIPIATPVDGETEVLPGIRAIPTPGHTAGSLCFVVEDAEAALVGDITISHGGVLTRPLRFANEDDAQYLETLRVFAVDAPGAGLPGHGEPVLEGFGDKLRALAELPRRRGSFRERARRLRRFARFVARRRMPTR
jgi:glyoxylase-like metal-dependent hydrolase (beta-lactamase superfamily II)